jgi:hypothetical protein
MAYDRLSVLMRHYAKLKHMLGIVRQDVITFIVNKPCVFMLSVIVLSFMILSLDIMRVVMLNKVILGFALLC